MLASGCGLVGNEGERQAAVVRANCLDCHNATEQVADLNLEALLSDAVASDAETWEKVIRKLRAGLMPPADGGPTLEREARDALVAWLENEIDENAEAHLPAPGLHRLNRTEYTNAIRDLLALNIDAATFLPPDDSSHGFDNMAGTLTTSPALMEAYLSAAGKISRLAIGTETAPTLAVFDAPHDTSQNGYIEGLPFGTRGGMLIEHEFPADGNYVFTVKGMTGYFTAVLGNVKGEKLEVTIDGARVYLYDWDKEIGTERRQRRPHAGDPDQGRLPQSRRHVHRHERPARHRPEPVVRSHDELAGLDLGLHVLPARRPGLHRRAVQRRRGHEHAEPRQDLRVLPRGEQRGSRMRAHDHLDAGRQSLPPPRDRRRRRGDDGVLRSRTRGRRQLRLRHRGRRAAHPRGSGVHLPAELEPADAAPGSPYAISDLELASRLSFFLWSSIPDEELVELASQGRLHERRCSSSKSRG